MQDEVMGAPRSAALHALQAMQAIVVRELLKFARQYGRLVSSKISGGCCFNAVSGKMTRTLVSREE